MSSPYYDPLSSREAAAASRAREFQVAVAHWEEHSGRRHHLSEDACENAGLLTIYETQTPQTPPTPVQTHEN